MNLRTLILFLVYGSTYIPYSCASVEEDFENLKSACETLKQSITRLQYRFEDIRDDKEKLTYRLRVLNQYIDNVETYYRNGNLEILGVPQVKGEDLIDILRNLSRTMDITFDESDISAVWRYHEDGRNNQTAPEEDSIIVKFVSRTKRNEWLTNARDRIVIYSKGCIPDLPESEIYINEHLTKAKKGLVKTAKLLEQNKKIPYAWLKDGQLYIRRTPSGKAVKIKSLQDLKLLGYID